MKKADLFKRFETAYKMGLLEPEVLRLAQDWCEVVMRAEGKQLNYVLDFIEREKCRTADFTKVLANDDVGYKAITLLSLLNHPCQICSEDVNAWHTRYGFCPHKKDYTEKNNRG